MRLAAAAALATMRAAAALTSAKPSRRAVCCGVLVWVWVSYQIVSRGADQDNSLCLVPHASPSTPSATHSPAGTWAAHVAARSGGKRVASTSASAGDDADEDAGGGAGLEGEHEVVGDLTLGRVLLICG